MWRRVQKLGFKAKYGNDQEFASEIRMIKALAYVDPSEINEYFNVLKLSLSPDALVLANWFKKNYISPKKNQGIYFLQLITLF